MGRDWACVIAVALVGVAACGGSPNAPHIVSPPKASASATIAPAAPLSAWQQLGATEVPPTSIQQVTLNGVPVVNQTNGAVSDGDARAWAEALLRTVGYVRWAVGRGQGQFLLRSGLSSAPVAVFQPNVNDITQARAAGSRVEYTLQTFRRFVVRPLPQSLQPSIQRDQEVWKPYAIYLDAVGPVETDWVDAQGRRIVKAHVAAGVPVYELIGGELSHHQVMGDVWVMASDFDCTATSTRQTLGQVCDQ
jgi:hypothetical protein